MAIMTVERNIRASVERVFNIVAHIQEFEKVIPHITSVRFLTERRTGVGTRFVETRVMKGKQHQTELEVAEYEPYRRVRMVAQAGGTTWDTLFQTIADELGGTD